MIAERMVSMKKGVLFIVLAALFCLFLVPASAEEIVLADNESVFISIKEMGASWDSFIMKVYLENRTGKTVMFATSDGVVNGYASDPFWAKEIAPGKKANETISFDGLSASGITGDVCKVQLSFRAYDSNDWLADNLFMERFTLYPLGEDHVVIHEREAQATDLVLADTDSFTLIVTGFDPDYLWGYAMQMYLVNKTDKTLMFSLDEVSVNGFMLDPFWACEVPPESRQFSSATWNPDEFLENGFTTIEEVEGRFKVYNSNDWIADPYFDGVCTIKAF